MCVACPSAHTSPHPAPYPEDSTGQVSVSGGVCTGTFGAAEGADVDAVHEDAALRPGIPTRATRPRSTPSPTLQSPGNGCGGGGRATHSTPGSLSPGGVHRARWHTHAQSRCFSPCGVPSAAARLLHSLAHSAATPCSQTNRLTLTPVTLPHGTASTSNWWRLDAASCCSFLAPTTPRPTPPPTRSPHTSPAPHRRGRRCPLGHRPHPPTHRRLRTYGRLEAPPPRLPQTPWRCRASSQARAGKRSRRRLRSTPSRCGSSRTISGGRSTAQTHLRRPVCSAASASGVERRGGVCVTPGGYAPCCGKAYACAMRIRALRRLIEGPCTSPCDCTHR